MVCAAVSYNDHDCHSRVSALVNKGNCLFMAGEIEKARDFYTEALSVESLCVEALFNLGS